MLRAIVRRLLRMVPVLLAVSLCTFFMMDLVPGDPVAGVLGPDVDPAAAAEIRSDLGLDRPVVERYVEWIGGVLTGDLGRQIATPREPVADLIGRRIGLTLQLAVLATLMASLVAVPLGVWSAYKAGQRFDRVASAVLFAMVSMPPFLTAVLFLFVFVFHPAVAQAAVALAVAATAVTFGRHAWRRRRVGRSAGRLVATALAFLGLAMLLFAFWPEFPRLARSIDDGPLERLRGLFLPALTLAVTEIAILGRLVRSDTRATLQQDYILSARAKGLPTWRVLLVDALRPSSFSALTVAGVSLGRLIGGTVIVETMFALDGLGSLVVSRGVVPKDVPVVQGGVLVIAAGYVIVNGLVDISYAALDPRIRRARG